LIVNINNDDIVVVPNGVDYKTYKVSETIKKYDLIFSGNMGYPPNIDSAIYLVNHVMPLIWKVNSAINLVIVGAEPDKRVLKLQSDNITVTGWVDSVADYYGQAKVFIAPMQIGTGLQNKLLEAMAMKLPCITSQFANNALGATHQKNILIGNNPKEYAQYVIDLLTDDKLALEIAENGYQFISKKYTWEGSTSILEKLIISKS
jgi:polysaccharide biosynthesis protein PslH